MTDQGFDPQTATTDQFVKICEGAESKAALRTKNDRNHSDDDSSKDWKKKDTFEKSEYKKKYKKKTRELNLLQKESKDSNPNNDISDGEVSKHSDPVRSKQDTETSDSRSSSSNSSTSSDTDSN
jgi:hypothetical protein